jgi:hypothetical protein
MRRVNRPIYALQLRALPHVVDDLRVLRGALKRLKRDLGFQCLSVVEIEGMARQKDANKIVERMRKHRLELCVYHLFDDVPMFLLSDGERVTEAVAQLLVKDCRLIATGDSSFRYGGS